MCFYCGCREIPLLQDLIAEHERVADLGARLVEAMGRGDVPVGRGDLAAGRGDLPAAERLLADFAKALDSHWRGEEAGLFAAMHADEGYRDYIDALVEEHRDLRELLATADLAAADDRKRIIAAVEGLYAHIAKEEDGLFPASLTALSGEQWDRSIAAWQAAHAADPVDAPEARTGSRHATSSTISGE